MRPMQRGTTLTELLAASTIGLVVLVTLGQMDVARVRMYEYIRHGSPSQPTNSEGGFALADILGDLKQADRVVLVDSAAERDATGARSLLIRAPGAGNLNNEGSYTWKQYTLNGDQIFRYDNMRCAEPMAYHGVSDFRVKYVDVAQPEPALGGDPFASQGKAWDNNVVQVTVSYGTGTRKVWGVATIPAAAYTNLHAVCSGTECDSGDGLAPAQWTHPTPCTR